MKTAAALLALSLGGASFSPVDALTDLTSRFTARPVAKVACQAFMAEYRAQAQGRTVSLRGVKVLNTLLDRLLEKVPNPSFRATVQEARRAATANPYQSLEVYKPVVKGCAAYL